MHTMAIRINQLLVYLIVLAVLIIPSVSALDFDNVKIYDPVTKTVKIDNGFGFLDELARVKLNTPLDNKVPLGYQKVAEMTFYNFKRDKAGFGVMKFYDLKRGMSKIERTFDYKYKTIVNVEEDVYELSCFDKFAKNGSISQDCSNVKTGTRSVQKEEWIKFNDPSQLPSGEVIVGIFTEVKEGDKVEWIPTFFGKEIGEWATWTTDLNVGLIAYYNFEESSGDLLNIVENVSKYNHTVFNSPTREVAGIIGNAYSFTASGSEYTAFTENMSEMGAGVIFTQNIWYKGSSFVTGGGLYTLDDAGGNDFAEIITSFTAGGCASGEICLEANDGMQDLRVSDTATSDDDAWHMATVVFNSSGGHLFRDGTFRGKTATPNSAVLPISPITFRFARTHTTNYNNITLDEAGLWNRSLTEAEITQLYNGGSGITYPITLPLNISTTLNSPADNTISTSNSLLLNATSTPSGREAGIVNSNLTNMTFFVWNETALFNSTVFDFETNESITQTFNITNLIDGAYEWNVFACATNGTATSCDHSTNGNFSFEIDQTAPIIYFNTTIQDSFVETFPVNVTLSAVTIDDHVDSCWYYTSDDATNITYTCNTTIGVQFISGGSKTIYAVANDTLGFEFQNSTSFQTATYSQSDDQDPIGEGDITTFTIELNKTGISSEIVTALLIYNNTAYGSPTISSTSANRTVVTMALTIPDGTGSPIGNVIDWYWQFNITNVGNYTASTQNQTVYSVDIDDCSVYGDLILNMTLLDENTRSLVNATVGSLIELDLDITSKVDGSVSWEYSNTWDDEVSAMVCVPSELLNNSEYRIDFVAEYSSTDRVTEFFYLDNGTLDTGSTFNSLTNKTMFLYDLDIADSTTFLFSFTDKSNLEVPNAIVHVFRKYIGQGEFYEVERGKQDDNGETHIHLVEEDVIYFFTISDQGEIIYTSSNYNAKCLSTPCSITLEAAAQSPEFNKDWDLMPNGTYSVTDDGLTRKVTLSFLTTEAAFMNLTIGKQDYHGDIEVVGSSQTFATSGSVSVIVPQSAGNITYYAIVYKDGSYIAHRIVDFTDDTNYYDTTGNVMGFLLIIALILMGAAEGILLFVFLIFALILVGALALFKLTYYAIIGFVCALAVIVWKLVKKGGRFS